MKDKGFTLVELLAVILVLGLLAMITIPSITATLKNNEQKLYKVQLGQIEEAAKGYVTENIFKIDLTSECVIYLKDLKDGNYIEKEISNPLTGNQFGDGLKVIVTPLNPGSQSTGYTIEVDTNTVDSTFIDNSLKCVIN